jgi:hypothetical protein
VGGKLAHTIVAANKDENATLMVLSMEDSVLTVGGGDPKVPLALPVAFTSALIQRGGSCPPLLLVELIQKSKHPDH